MMIEFILAAGFIVPLGNASAALRDTKTVNMKKELKVWVGPVDNILFPTIDTYSSRAYGRDTVYSAVLGRLLYLDIHGKLHPGLLESWTHSSDHKHWRLKLRPNLRFHNGRMVEATDLEYSLIRYLISPRNSPGKAMRQQIEGVENLTGGTAFHSGIISGVKVLDQRTVEVVLKKGDPNFAANYAGSRDSLVPREAIANDHFSWKTLPIGAGPYKVVSAQKDGKLVRVEKYAGYGKLSPRSPDTIEFFSGQPQTGVQIAMGDRNNPDPVRLKEVALDIPAFVWGIYFNYHSKLGADLRFRKAIASAVDRSKLLEKLTYASATSEMVPSVFEGHLGVQSEFNPEKAKRILQEISSGDKELVVPIANLDLSSPAYSWIAVAMEQLRHVGLRIRTEVTSKPLFDSNDSESPFFIVGYYPDCDSLTIFRTFREGGPWVTRLSEHDRAYEALLDEDFGALTAARRRDVLEKLGRRFQEQQYAFPLFEQQLTYFIDPARVEDIGQEYQRHIMVFERLQLR